MLQAYIEGQRRRDMDLFQGMEIEVNRNQVRQGRPRFEGPELCSLLERNCVSRLVLRFAR